jgi:hypothetical protein
MIMLERPRQQSQENKKNMIKRDKEEIKSISKLVKRLKSIYV